MEEALDLSDSLLMMMMIIIMMMMMMYTVHAHYVCVVVYAEHV